MNEAVVLNNHTNGFMTIVFCCFEGCGKLEDVIVTLDAKSTNAVMILE